MKHRKNIDTFKVFFLQRHIIDALPFFLIWRSHDGGPNTNGVCVYEELFPFILQNYLFFFPSVPRPTYAQRFWVFLKAHFCTQRITRGASIRFAFFQSQQHSNANAQSVFLKSSGLNISWRSPTFPIVFRRTPPSMGILWAEGNRHFDREDRQERGGFSPDVEKKANFVIRATNAAIFSKRKEIEERLFIFASKNRWQNAKTCCVFPHLRKALKDAFES